EGIEHHEIDVSALDNFNELVTKFAGSQNAAFRHRRELRAVSQRHREQVIDKFCPVDLVVQAARLDPPPYLVRVVLQADIKNSAPLKHMLAGNRSSSS